MITPLIFLNFIDYSKNLAKAKKEARRMVCDCVLPYSDDRKAGVKPCGDDCLNRVLMIEW